MASPIRIPIFTTAGLLALWLGVSIWSGSEADRKLNALGEVSRDKSLSIILTLAFAPEAFHFARTQRVGQLTRTEGDRMFIKNADRDGLADLARAYWVLKVEPWNEQ